MSGPRTSGMATVALHAGPAGNFTGTVVDALERRIAALEGGVAGLAAASGQAALHLAVATLAASGHHVVAASELGTDARRLLAHALPRLGITTTFVDARDPDAWRAAIRPETRLLVGSALGGARLDVLDIPRVAALAHDHDLPLLVDATRVSPWLLRPLDHGADLVLHAGDACLGGPGGLLVDGGGFDWQRAWERSGRYAELCTPSDGGDGIVYIDESPVAAFALRARAETLRDFGAALGDHAAGVLLHGLETLAARMERHTTNAARVADFLAAHPAVAAVHHPGLPAHPDHALAAQLLPRGAGPALAFDLAGAGAAQLIADLEYVAPAAAQGGARSLAAQAAPGTVALWIGLEDADDLLDDLGRALARHQKRLRKGA